MSAEGDAAIYAMFLEDLYAAFKERFDELDADYGSLSEYDQGKWLAYYELLDAMKTRNKMIAEIIDEHDDYNS